MDVRAWLSEIKLEKFADAFQSNGVDSEMLPDLTNEDLKDLGVARLKDRKVLLAAIAALSASALTSETTAPSAADRSRLATGGEGERRHLSVMFVDLVGSTEMAARLDPEQVVQILNTYRDACITQIAAHDGFISNYLGDGVVALFGFPIAHEDDAAQALRAGLAIIEAVKELSPGLSEALPDGMNVRVGVASGLVVVGDMDTIEGNRVNSVIGDTPNLAARLQEHAGVNGLAVSDTTKRLAEGLFTYLDLGPNDVKGFEKPIRIWRVERLEEIATRFEARTVGALSVLVGREQELENLLLRWSQTRAGHGQVVLLSGEAGIGKSRLCHTLKETALADDPAIMLLQCSPYQRNSALYPFITELRASADLGNATGQSALDYLKLQSAGRNDEVAAALFARLLSVAAPDDALTDLSAPEQKQRTLHALWNRIAAQAEGRPLLIFFEDAHWIDPTSRELLALAAEAVASLPIFLVVTHRSEITFDWAELPHVLSLPLGRLGAAEARRLVESVIGRDLLAPELMAKLLERTDGVPLFIEEMARMLAERVKEGDADGLANYEDIPATIHDLLLARLDRLGPDKRIAQLAACFGRFFTGSQLDRITSISESKVIEALVRLLESDLIQAHEVEGVFLFRHALVQNAAYESLLQSRRAELHSRIAAVLELDASTEPHMLAHHFGRAGNHKREVECWRLAGQAAMQASAFVEAVAYFRNALKACANLPEPASSALELELQVLIAVPLTLTRGWSAAEVSESYNRAHDLCKQVGASTLLFPARSGIFGFQLVSGQHQKALELATENLKAAQATNDPAIILEFEFQMGAALFYSGRVVEAPAHLKRVVELFDRDAHSKQLQVYGRCPATVTLAHLGNSLAILGEADGAFAAARESEVQADASGHQFSKIWARSNHAITHMLFEDEAACDALAAYVISEGDKHGFVNWSSQGRVWASWCRARRGEAEAALVGIREGMSIWEKTGAELMRPVYHVLLAETLRLLGRDQEARDALVAAEAITNRTGELFMRPGVEIALVEVEHALRILNASDAATRIESVGRAALNRGERLWAIKAGAAAAVLRGVPGGLLTRTLGTFDGHIQHPAILRARRIAEGGIIA